MYGVALSFGDLTATLQTHGEYNSMVMEDMCNQARTAVIELLAALPDAEADDASGDTPGLSHHQAMRRDLLQEDE
jgi:hypothetical protein